MATKILINATDITSKLIPETVSAFETVCKGNLSVDGFKDALEYVQNSKLFKLLKPADVIKVELETGKTRAIKAENISKVKDALESYTVTGGKVKDGDKLDDVKW